MSTPHPKYFCPRCRTAYDADHLYCGRCGADMHKASRLNLARQEADAVGGPSLDATVPVPAVDDAAAVRPGGSDPFDPWLGRIIDGRYRVIDVIGRGGMGVVYKISHQRMGKVAAMKVLHRDLATDREVIQRFHREAEAVSRLTHPNTVQVFDFGVAQSQPYLVMEYVRGLDLGSLVERDGPLGFARAAPLFAQVCGALAEAHELGVVHRDLKPENILVSRSHSDDEFVKVLDFGLAKLAEREEVASVTGRGSIVGTPYYMAPEQIRGEAVDGRTDLYSLGALMYRVLTGETPFTAKTPVGVLTKHLTEPLVPPSRRAPGLSIPPEVDALCLRAMAKVPGERFASATELLDELEQSFAAVSDATTNSRRLRGGRHASAPAAGPAASPAATDRRAVAAPSERMLRRSDLDRFERAIKRRRLVGVIGLPAVAIAAAGGAYFYYAWRDGQPSRSEREPNDDPGQATLIAPGTAVTGLIGQRISQAEGDRDVFRLAARPAGTGDVVSARLRGLPNLDLELLLHDRAGQLVARVDESGIGGDEVLHDLRVSEPFLITIGEARADGSRALPTENVSDRYELVVELGPLADGRAAEPDDGVATAAELAIGAPRAGFLDRRDDVDLFRFSGPPGRYRLALVTPPELPLRASWGAAPVVVGQPVELVTGAILRLERDDRGRPRGEALPAADQPYSVGLEPER